MESIADGVFVLDGFPKYAVNVYLIDDVVVDAATKFAARRILRQLEGRDVSAHALTHVHPDHQGASKAICDALNIPLYCGENDSDAMESGDFSHSAPRTLMNRLQGNSMHGPAYPVTKRLKEGDEVGGFEVVDSPGHSPGHVSYWRASDRVLIIGDVVFGMNLATTRPGLHQPPKAFTVDPALNRDSARKLAKMDPQVICFGHGPPCRDPERFQKFVSELPD